MLFSLEKREISPAKKEISLMKKETGAGGKLTALHAGKADLPHLR
jgi:hypothetical protein